MKLASMVIFVSLISVGLSAEAQVATPTQTAYKSLMFSAEELGRMRQALAGFAGGLPLTEDVPGAPTEEAPKLSQFYLNGIVHHSEQDWIVWLNGIKFTPDQPTQQDLTLLSLDRQRARFSWAPADFTLYATKPIASTDVVQRDDMAKTIVFSLAPNQTFSALTMQVVEGRVAPPAAPATPGPETPASAATPAPVPNAAAPVPADDSDDIAAMKKLNAMDKGVPTESTLSATPTFEAAPPVSPALR